MLGVFLHHFATSCFVIEDEAGVCGYIAACHDVVEYRSMAQDSFLPQLRKKYPQSTSPSDTKKSCHERFSAEVSRREKKYTDRLPELVYNAFLKE